MKLPDSIPKSLKCPFCYSLEDNVEANLEWQLHPHPNGIKSKYLSYYCDKCKNGFTTTESDEISLKLYNSKKRSLMRKDKIKRINEL